MILSFGPLTLDAARLSLLAGVALAALLALALTRRQDARALPALALAFGAGLLSARLAYVLLHGVYYVREPLEVLKLYKGGFLVWAGVAAFLACLLLQAREPRRLPVLLPGLTGLALAAVLHASLGSGSEEPRTLPDLALSDLNGRPARLADYAGRPLVLNLWASWCPPCRQEMPVLAAAEAARPEVAFLYLNQGEDPQTIALYLEETGLTLGAVLRDPDSSASKRLAAYALPTTLFVDAEGVVRDAYTGELSPPRLADGLRRLR